MEEELRFSEPSCMDASLQQHHSHDRAIVEGPLSGEEVVVRLAWLVGGANVNFQRRVKIELRQRESGLDRPALGI